MRRFTTVALLMAVTAVAAGCGGSGGYGSGGRSTATAADTAAAGGGASHALSGSVGPGFDISMDRKEVAAGKYTLTVDDKATSHNFHLTGPGGVDVKTDISGTGVKTFDVTLEKGSYTFVCDAHVSSMQGTLTVD